MIAIGLTKRPSVLDHESRPTGILDASVGRTSCERRGARESRRTRPLGILARERMLRLDARDHLGIGTAVDFGEVQSEFTRGQDLPDTGIRSVRRDAVR